MFIRTARSLLIGYRKRLESEYFMKAIDLEMTTTDKTIEDTLEQMARRLCESTGANLASVEVRIAVHAGKRDDPSWRGYVDGLNSHVAPSAQDILAHFAKQARLDPNERVIAACRLALEEITPFETRLDIPTRILVALREIQQALGQAEAQRKET